MKDRVNDVILRFCGEFVKDPYLCYTEHGIHALFFQRLYDALPEEERYFIWNDQRVCVLQKEYPTACDLGKPKRSNWDISLIRTPPETLSEKNPYDYFRLDTVVEFGLNEAGDHLKDDIQRLAHAGSNVDNKYCVHLYRFSEGISGRDWSIRSKRILSLKEIMEMVSGTAVTVYLAVADATDTFERGMWKITKDSVSGSILSGFELKL